MARKKSFFNPALFPKPTEEPIYSLSREAFACLTEAEYWIDRYNECASQLIRNEYNNFIIIDLIGNCGREMKAEWIFPILEDGPTPSGFKKYHHDDPKEQPRPRQPKQSIKELRMELGAFCSWICIYCQKQGTPENGPDNRQWHVDHMFAVARGGDSSPDNLILSCATCNQKKHAKLASEILSVIKAKLEIKVA